MNGAVPQAVERIRAALRCGRPNCRCRYDRTVHCPAHDDRHHASLVVNPGDHVPVVVHCKAGCRQAEVIAALRRRGLWPRSARTGLAVADLTVAQLAHAKRLDPNQLRRWGVHDFTYRYPGRGAGPAVAIPYGDLYGTIRMERRRLHLGRNAHDDRFRVRPNNKLIPYGLWALPSIRSQVQNVAEGETDTWCLWSAGIPALGVPGAGNWQASWAVYLEGCEVTVWPDRDSAGDRLARSVLTSRPDTSVARLPDGCKDLADLWILHEGEPEAFRVALEAIAGPLPRIVVPPLIHAVDGKLTAATKLLRDLLARQPRLTEEVEQIIIGRGISERTLNTARRRLGVLAYQQGRRWWLRLSGCNDGAHAEP